MSILPSAGWNIVTELGRQEFYGRSVIENALPSFSCMGDDPFRWNTLTCKMTDANI